MKVYKVVAKRHGELKSAIMRKSGRQHRATAQLTYKAGVTTKPKFGKIFVFGNQADATSFRKMHCSIGEIWRADAPDPEPINWIASDSIYCKGCLSRFKRFWKNGVSDTMPSPAGTMVCSEVTLLEKVI